MFQNSYQNGTFFEVFDPKLPQDKTKNLFKLQNVQPNHKVFDKNLKTFIYEFSNSNSKVTFPKEEKKQLYLIQQYLNLQIEFTNNDWHIELAVSDLTRTKRRIILSPSFHKVQKKPFFVKSPCPPIKQGIWASLCIDLYSFIGGFKGQTYRSLDSIQIIGSLKLRRIFTTNNPISDHQESHLCHQSVLLPKNMMLPVQVEAQNYFIQFEDICHEQNSEQVTESTAKSTSNIISSKHIKKQIFSKKQIKEEKPKMSKIAKDQQKIEVSQSIKEIEICNAVPMKKQETKTKLKDEKKFLANTNGLEVLKSKKQICAIVEKNQSSDMITPLSTGKALKRRRQPLSKTQIAKQKRVSIDNKLLQKPGVNGKDSSASKKKLENEKVNPWRSSTSKKHETGRCEGQKIQEVRKIESAEATLFKTRNNVGKQADMKGRVLDKNSDISRESDYFELSQKFSTVTSGRFFKNEQILKNCEEQRTKQAHDEIEQNIEIQANSYYSNSNPNSNQKNKQNVCLQLQQKPIEQSINDSLDCLNKQKGLNENQSYFNMSSRHGFGQRMVNKFMRQLERPYSPPLGEHTEQQEDGGNQEKKGSKGVQLIYDPVLNCYYDHKTHTYYELKN